MLKWKRKLGIKFPQLEVKKGWLKGWLDEYHREDRVLKLEAYSLSDL